MAPGQPLLLREGGGVVRYTCMNCLGVSSKIIDVLKCKWKKRESENIFILNIYMLFIFVRC